MITTRSFSLFLQSVLWLGEQLFLTGRNWRIVFHHSIKELKHCAKKSRFSQIRQRINLILLAKPKLPRHLILKTCGCS
ncbi:hypothetical protein NEOC95_000457 [Neochlamydia sp. AcF95]|nr:hypothetical protein [Neochlamydia sp. AcF95]